MGLRDMTVEYTEWLGVTRTVDLDEFWLEHLSSGIAQAEKNWQHFKTTGEPYCYGRNLYYDEEWDKRAWQSPEKFKKRYSDMWNGLIQLFNSEQSYLSK